MIFIKILKNIIQVKKHNIFNIFDDINADMLSNKKLYPIVTQLFTRGKKNLTFLLLL